MLKNYELLYIIHPDLEGTSEKVTEKVAGFITKQGGEVTSQEDWGKRKLAYRINKNDFGVYVLVNFTLESENLPKIERDLRLSEEIMRSMIVVLPEMKEAKKSARLAKKEAKAEKKVAEPKEEVKTEEPKETPVAEEVAEAPAKKPRAKKPVSSEVEKAEKAEEVAGKPAKKAAAKKEKAEKPATKPAKTEETEADRMKKLDEKLGEILGE